MSNFTSSAFFKTFYRNPSILPAHIVEKIDRVIRPKSKTVFTEIWMTARMMLRYIAKVVAFTAALPMLAVMLDPLFQGGLMDGKTFSFEEYQRFLQSEVFWSIAVGITLLSWPIYVYFNGLAIYLRDRQRAEQSVNKG